MIPTLTAQQVAFFAKNGFLELEGILNPEEIAQIGKLKPGRDLWRTTPVLKRLLLSRKLRTITFALSGKDRLMLALDHCFEPNFSLEHSEKLKSLFSVQGLSLCVFFQAQEPPSIDAPKLGHHPFCQAVGNILIVRPELLITWPSFPSTVYLASYCHLNALYVDNPRDPAAGALRALGYEYGDPLRAETHPLLQRADHR